VTEGYVRLSVGLEHIDDILADLERGLAAAGRSQKWVGDAFRLDCVRAAPVFRGRRPRLGKPPTLDDRSSVDVQFSRVCESGDRQRNGGGGG